jgi:putative SOS response-associated peptidase YedK
MCGRFVSLTPAEALQRLFGSTNPLVNLPARYNIAPTQTVAALRFNPASGERSLDLLRWGLIPHWAKDAAIAGKTFNARAETLADKPAFRAALASRRCLIPADAFYEWKAGSQPKQPFAIRRRDHAPFCFAGLWENWRQPDGQWLRTCTIITTAANAALAPLHHRMPVILDAADYPLWLGEQPGTTEQRQALLRPCPPDWLEVYAVGPAVGKVAIDDPSLLEPLAA